MQFLPPAILISFLIRLLITGASVGDSIVMIALCGLYAGHLYMESKKQVPVNKEIVDKINQLEELMNKTRDKVNTVAFSHGLKK